MREKVLVFAQSFSTIIQPHSGLFYYVFSPQVAPVVMQILQLRGLLYNLQNTFLLQTLKGFNFHNHGCNPWL